MRRRLGLALAMLPALPLVAAAPPRQAPFAVAILAPAPGEPLFGEVEVRVATRPAAVRLQRVEVYLDGVRVGVMERPPWRLAVEVGGDNVAHQLEVVAHDPTGATATATLHSGAITVQEQIEVALRPLFVRVERGGAPVHALGRDDFTVYDEGVRQRLVTFERGDVPFTAVLLLDASTSMQGGRLETAVDAVASFGRAMRPADEAKLLLFADHLLLETPFSNAPSFLTLGLPAALAQGGTALNDALYLALSRLASRNGRKVVMLLSDGVDVESVVPMEAVRDEARRGAILLYWLRLGGAAGEGAGARAFTPWRDEAAHRREGQLLREAVGESGGRIVEVGALAQARAALDDVLQELREQYVLGYYPSVSRGRESWHEVRVEVAGGGEVRTHRGYLEP
jgi:Ca-activated chloride channel family protein